MNTISVPIQPLMKEVTLNVEVTGVTVWKIRQRLGAWLIMLAAFVMGCDVHVELD